MDFNLTDEQAQLRDSVNRFIEAEYPFETRCRHASLPDGFSRDVWRSFAELGWLMVPFAEADGGIGGGTVETMVLMEAFGRGLVLEPYLTTVVLGGSVLRQGATSGQRERWLPPLMQGELLVAVACTEPQSRYDLNDVATTARRDGTAWRLTGHKSVVLHAATADLLLVPARTSGSQRDADGITLFAVDPQTEGVRRRDYPTMDGGRASDLELDNVLVGPDDVIGQVDGGLPLLSAAVDGAIVAVGAEALGGMDVLCQMTVEYSRNRVQFGQPIGKFQVLQHRMVDMFMECEQTRSLVYLATLRLPEGGAEAERAVAALKVQVGKGGRFVGQQAVQLHGAIGMTEDFAVSHYFKRLTAIDSAFGNVDHHLQRFASVAG